MTLVLLNSTVCGSDQGDRCRAYTHKRLGSEFCINITLEGSYLHIAKFKHWLNEIVKVPMVKRPSRRSSNPVSNSPYPSYLQPVSQLGVAVPHVAKPDQWPG